MNDPDQPILLDYEGAAALLSMTRGALRDLVYKGRGPRVRKIGRRCYFARSDLEVFVNELPVDEMVERMKLSEHQTL